MLINSLGNRNGQGVDRHKRMISAGQRDFTELVKQSMQKTEECHGKKVSISGHEALTPASKAATINNTRLSDEIKLQRKSQVTEGVTFSETYQEKLEQIEELNARTDWASMSDAEKVRTFQGRYEEAFGGKKFFLVGALYMSFSKQKGEIYDRYVVEKEKYFGSEGIAKTEGKYQDHYREVYYGGKSDEEVRAAIREKWQGMDSMEDRYAVLAEYTRCGVSIEPAHSLMRFEIDHDIFAKVEGILGPSLRGKEIPVSQHPRFLEYFMTYAKGVGEGADFKSNWTQMSENIMEIFERSSRQKDGNGVTQEELEELRHSLDDFLADMVGRK